MRSPFDCCSKEILHHSCDRCGHTHLKYVDRLENNKIVDIELKSHAAWMGKKAEEIILERIIEQQTTDVDVVSGATNSSIVIMNAVQEAVEKSYHN